MISASRLFMLFFVAFSFSGGAFQAAAQDTGKKDRHAGYYYPMAEKAEVYTPRIGVASDATPQARISFVTAINAKNEERGYAPDYIASVKGVDDEKLLIIATRDGVYDTIYRIRALLGQLTSKSRLTPLYSQVEDPENLTFLDVAYFMGFVQVSVSDGESLTHQIVFE